MRIHVGPGPDQTFARHSQTREHTGHRVGVAVSPAADRVHRTSDPRGIYTYRSALPVRVAALVPEPDFREERSVRESLQPHLAPTLADQLGVGRQGVQGKQDRAPDEVLVEQATAHVVRVVGVAIVGRANGDDRLELGRSERRDLQRVETAPREPHHPHGARTPRLPGDPTNRSHAIFLLLLGVFVEKQAVGFAGATDVDTHGGVTMAGEVAVHRFVAPAGVVALPVGDVLDDRRHRRGLGILRPPDAGGQAAAVRQGDPGVLDLRDLSRERLDDSHLSPSGLVAAVLSRNMGAICP